jgi:sodium/proline symporter
VAPETTILAVSLVYMAALLAIGFAAARRTRSPDDSFLASRSLGSWVTAVSSTAASESGWVVLGTVGMAYTQGVTAL